MNKETKGKKYLIYALMVGLLGSMMAFNSSIGEFLTSNSSDEALMSNFTMSSEEQTEIVQEEKQQVEDDIVVEEPVHVEEVLESKVAETKEEVKEELKQEEKQESKEEKQESKQEAKVETPKVDLSPINEDQYVVKANDTLFHIAQRSKVSLDTIKSLNNINADEIIIGQILTIRSNGDTANNKPVTEVASRGDREEDLYWLSRIIHAESQGEPYEGKVAVGNVILNRVKSNLFPNTIKGVVFDKQHGYTQFSPVLDGNIYNTPNADSIKAAKDALSGVRPVGEALYFLNLSKSTNFWIVENRVFYKTIGDHDFYY